MALCLLGGLQGAMATYQLFISSENLESLYEGTADFETVEGKDGVGHGRQL